MPYSQDLRVAVHQRILLQHKIRQKFGDDLISLKYRELCQRCKAVCPELLPITLDGEDCPYFQEKSDE